MKCHDLEKGYANCVTASQVKHGPDSLQITFEFVQ